MNKLNLPHAKLFYAVGEAYRKRLIDQSQKNLLKEKIFNDDQNFFHFLEQCEGEDDLVEKLIGIIRPSEPQHLNAEVNINGQPVQDPNQQDQVSSPWGMFICRKKRYNQQHSHDVKQIIDLIKPKKTD